jgi:hypothetical protein
MKDKINIDLLKSQFESASFNQKENNIVWKSLPDTKIQIGYDGEYNLVRIPENNNKVHQNEWKKLNYLIRRKNILIKGKYYILLAFDNENLEIVASFLLELIRLIEDSEEEENTQKIIEKLISQWKKYWMEGKITFSKIEQIGLIGELLVLEKLIDIQDNILKKKSCLDLWKADEIGAKLHDFQGPNGNLEVKTSATIPRKIFVDKLDQFDNKKISPKSLTLLYVKLIEGKGMTLPKVVERVKSKFSKVGSSIEFEEMIEKRGYKSSDITEYNSNEFSDEYTIDEHLVNENTPIYTSKDLNKKYEAVYTIIQKIDADEINFNTVQDSDWVRISEILGI